MMRIVLLLLIVLTFVGGVLVNAKKAKPKTTPAPQTQVFDYEYRLSFGAYNCEHNVTSKAAFTTCTAQKNGWVSVCGAQCISKNYNNPTSQTQCVGIAKRLTTTCVLVECNKGKTLLPPIPAKGVGRKPAPVSAILARSCFTPLPSPSPTTARPTVRPTKPSSAPIAACSVSGFYGPEFKSLEGADPQLSAYTQVIPNRNMCEYVKTTLSPSDVEVVTGFTCSLEVCVRWCTYAAQCAYVKYSPVTQTCYRARDLQLTDDPNMFQAYYDEQWVVYRKNTVPGIYYLGGQCSNYLQPKCSKDPQCGWNKGRKPNNLNLQNPDPGSWCGRIKCFAATSG